MLEIINPWIKGLLEENGPGMQADSSAICKVLLIYSLKDFLKNILTCSFVFFSAGNATDIFTVTMYLLRGEINRQA